MSGAKVTIRPSTIYISPSHDPRYSRTQSIYTSSPTSFTRPTSTTHEISKPASSSASRQSSALSRPSTIYTSANIAQSFKVIRRQRTRKSNNNSTSRRDTRNVLNQTLDNFYNILRRTKTDQTIKSAKTWVNEYENYRKSVIYEEKEYERYQSSLMMMDDDNIYGNRRNDSSPCKSPTYDTSYSYRNSMYERSPPCKSFTTYENHSSSPYLRGDSPGATEKRTNGISAINGRRQLSKNSVGVDGHKASESLYSNYF